MSPEQAQKIIEATCAQLSEHFEAVHILASCPIDGATLLISNGRGNYFARLGMAKSFLERDSAQELASFLSE